MTPKDNKSARTVLATLVLLAAVLGGLWLFGRDHGGQTAYRQAVHTAQLVQQMDDALNAAAQAEKQAVMAETDEDSRRFASNARSATNTVGALLAELKRLPQQSPQQAELLSRFEAAFAEYLKADQDVLGLAVQNTNIKALGLSFGKAALALGELEQALRPLQNGASDSQARQALRVLSEALRIQALHAPHIMEKTDQRMDALEQRMAASDKAAREALAALGTQQAGVKALAIYEQYWALTAEIIGLSRQNTNVRSLALSLERKTKVLESCAQTLRALEENAREDMASKATR